VVEKGIQFAGAQIDAGVDLIGIGDAAASLVGPDLYKKYVFPYEKKLIDGIHELGGKIRLHICGDTRPNLREMGQLNCEIVDLDFMVPVAEAREKMGPSQILLGNLDPVRVLLEGSEVEVKDELLRCINEGGSRYIIGAGCEIPRGTPEINIHAMKSLSGVKN
jgi:MtaA/CmuA family methyltransferase